MTNSNKTLNFPTPLSSNADIIILFTLNIQWGERKKKKENNKNKTNEIKCAVLIIFGESKKLVLVNHGKLFENYILMIELN